MEKKIWIGLTVLIILLIGTTFAWWTWNSTVNTDVSLTINGIDVTYVGGSDITGVNLIPVSSKEVGISKNSAIEKVVTASSTVTTYMNLYLTLETLPDGLKEETFVYEIYNGVNLVGSGNFKNNNQGDKVKIASDQIITSSTTSFQLYIWIDGTVDNPSTMMNQSFKFILSADATDKEPVKLADEIKSLSKGNTWESGAEGLYEVSYTKEDGTTIGKDYRYIGANVHNYVKFNNDMYQIIGVFDENTHGKQGEYLVKLILADKLTANGWGAYNSSATSGTYSSHANDWTGKQSSTVKTPANLNILLNQYFLNKTDTSATYGSCSDWTYFSGNNNYKTKDCQTLVGYGIDASIRDYIETTTWHLNGYSSNSLTSNNFYLCERGMYTDCTSANSGAGDTATSAKIGLMYPSDYMYASGYKGNTSTLTGSTNYNGSQNWMFKGYEWTIMPRSDNSNLAFSVTSDGYFNLAGYTNLGHGARPTFYLKSSIKITGGEGTFENPYTIG